VGEGAQVVRRRHQVALQLVQALAFARAERGPFAQLVRRHRQQQEAGLHPVVEIAGEAAALVVAGFDRRAADLAFEALAAEVRRGHPRRRLGEARIRRQRRVIEECAEALAARAPHLGRRSARVRGRHRDHLAEAVEIGAAPLHPEGELNRGIAERLPQRRGHRVALDVLVLVGFDPAGELVDRQGPAEAAAQHRHGEGHRHDRDRHVLREDGPGDPLVGDADAADQPAADRHVEDGQDPVDQHRRNPAATLRRHLSPAPPEDRRRHHRHAGADRPLRPEGVFRQSRRVVNLKHRPRPSVPAAEGPLRDLHDGADEVADQHGDDARPPAQSSRGEGEQQVEDHRQDQRGEDQADRGERRHPGAGEFGEQPDKARGDHQRAQAARRPPQRRGDPGPDEDRRQARREDPHPARPGRARVEEQRDVDQRQRQRRGTYERISKDERRPVQSMRSIT
jgi:hypothetical protein